MVSDTAKYFSTSESRYRVGAANAMARDILVLGLDRRSSAVLRPLVQMPWQGARFASLEDGKAPMDTALDLIIAIGMTGENLGGIEAVGLLCIPRGIKVAGILLADAAPMAALSDGLKQMRLWCRTLMVLSDSDCLEDALRALGA